MASGSGGRDRIAQLLASEEDRTLYVSGCASNQGKFYDRFNAIVLLSAPVKVILDRVGNRTTNFYEERLNQAVGPLFLPELSTGTN